MFDRPDMISPSPATWNALKVSHGDACRLTIVAKTAYLDWELPKFNRAQGIPVTAYRGLLIRTGLFRQCFWDTPQRGALHSTRLNLFDSDDLDKIALHVWRCRSQEMGTGISVDAVPWQIHAIEDPTAYAAAKAAFLATRG